MSKYERGLESAEAEVNIQEWGLWFSAAGPLGQPLRCNVGCVSLDNLFQFCAVTIHTLTDSSLFRHGKLSGICEHSLRKIPWILLFSWRREFANMSFADWQLTVHGMQGKINTSFPSCNERWWCVFIDYLQNLLCSQFNEFFQQVNSFIELLSQENLRFDPELNLRKNKNKETNFIEV